MNRRFNSPDELRKFLLALSAQFRVEGSHEQAKQLEHVAKLACTTGREWLGEISLVAERVQSLQPYSADANEKLALILQTARSSNPYA